MLTYHTNKGLNDIRDAINAYEVRNTKKITMNIDDDSIVNLASGIVVVDGVVQSVSVNLKLYDLTIVKEIVCKKYCKSEIVIFEQINELIMFLYKARKEQLVSDADLRIGKYA